MVGVLRSEQLYHLRLALSEAHVLHLHLLAHKLLAHQRFHAVVEAAVLQHGLQHAVVRFEEVGAANVVFVEAFELGHERQAQREQLVPVVSSNLMLYGKNNHK